MLLFLAINLNHLDFFISLSKYNHYVISLLQFIFFYMLSFLNHRFFQFSKISLSISKIELLKNKDNILTLIKS